MTTTPASKIAAIDEASALVEWQRGHFRVPITFHPPGHFLLTDIISSSSSNKTTCDGGGGGSSSIVASLADEMVVVGRFNNGPCMMDQHSSGVDTQEADNLDLATAPYPSSYAVEYVANGAAADSDYDDDGDVEVEPGSPTWLASFSAGIQASQHQSESSRMSTSSSSYTQSQARKGEAKRESISSHKMNKKVTAVGSGSLAKPMNNTSPPLPLLPTPPITTATTTPATNLHTFTTTTAACDQLQETMIQHDKQDTNDDDDDDDDAKGTYAIGSCEFGEGRVILLSPHFESTPIQENSLSKTAAADELLKTIVRNAVISVCNKKKSQ
jgi:hypothetical protein